MEVDLRKAGFFEVRALGFESWRRLLGQVERRFSRGQHRFRGHVTDGHVSFVTIEGQIGFEVVLIGGIAQKLEAEILGVHAEAGLDYRESIPFFGRGRSQRLRWIIREACIDFGRDLTDFRLSRGLELVQMGRISGRCRSRFGSLSSARRSS
jgi:hypothetical protein